MNYNTYLRLKGFYENELINNILSFWMPRCEDTVYGGFLNCFDNEGKKLVSYDKYTWSQGRFLWLFSKLASTSLSIFTNKQRQEFLRLAKMGKDFLTKYCLLKGEDARCVFLMERDGTHKYVQGCDVLDMSIYADCFVILGMAGYAAAAMDADSYAFGKKIYMSVLDRVETGKFHTLPYPLSKEYRAHGIPMILLNVTKELYGAAKLMDLEFCQFLEKQLEKLLNDILDHFVDDNDVVHEIITAKNSRVEGMLGQHANPGHTLEDMWFLLDAADLLRDSSVLQRVAKISLKTLQIGWDEEHGGILHYCDVDGGIPRDREVCTDEPMERQVREGWGDKLWWVHSEALYTTLLCFSRTHEPVFWEWHEKIFEYTFKVFPNNDPEIREWKQICKQDGKPQDKVVALPVKDPFHILRNLVLILELLDKDIKVDLTYGKF